MSVIVFTYLLKQIRHAARLYSRAKGLGDDRQEARRVCQRELFMLAKLTSQQIRLVAFKWFANPNCYSLMNSKLILLVTIAALCNVGLSQIGTGWYIVTTQQEQLLNNDNYFRMAKNACLSKITTEGYTFSLVSGIRQKFNQGQFYEFALNDTLNNVHVCVMAILPATQSVNMTKYLFVVSTKPVPTGKSIASDNVSTVSGPQITIEDYQDIQNIIAGTAGTIEVSAAQITIEDHEDIRNILAGTTTTLDDSIVDSSETEATPKTEAVADATKKPSLTSESP